MKPIIRDGLVLNAAVLQARDVVNKRVLCPGCATFIFEKWPEEWDTHAGFRCKALEGTEYEERKLEFKRQFQHLFRK